jgi:hypothetical protein
MSVTVGRVITSFYRPGRAAVLAARPDAQCSPAIARHPHVPILDPAVQAVAAAVFLYEGVEGGEEFGHGRGSIAEPAERDAVRRLRRWRDGRLGQRPRNFDRVVDRALGHDCVCSFTAQASKHSRSQPQEQRMSQGPRGSGSVITLTAVTTLRRWPCPPPQIEPSQCDQSTDDDSKRLNPPEARRPTQTQGISGP